MVMYIFLKFEMVKVFETLHTVSNVKMNIFRMNIFNDITLLLFIINIFIKVKVLVIGQLFNWVEQTDNTASVQWGFTVYIF